MAISLTPTGGKTAVGVAYVHAQTVVDTDAQMVTLNNIEIPKIHFPSLDTESVKQLDQLARTFIPPSMPISVHRVVACVPKPEKTPTAPVKNDPPPIFVSFAPAIMLFVDGEPAMGKIENTKLEFVVNTSWPLFLDRSTLKYYLLVDRQWLAAAKLEGPWAASTTLPKEMSGLPADPQWAQLKEVIPPPPVAGAAVPKVFYSSTPAEVILFDGKPVLSRIQGTQLLFATNTSSNVFTDAPTKQFYFLAVGRWFRAGSLDGPWSFASGDLPADFARIPYDSPASRVLVSVPGTEEAKDAVMLAQIPTTMTVDPQAAAAQAKVAYDGTPQFKPIEGTSLSYATNTQDKAIKVGDVYYLCLQGIWFMSTTPQGPWKTAASVPQQIYMIPPSSPVYNVTYVTQTTTPSGQVQSSYTGGYMGVFVMGVAVGAVVANNSGYYYPPMCTIRRTVILSITRIPCPTAFLTTIRPPEHTASRRPPTAPAALPPGRPRTTLTRAPLLAVPASPHLMAAEARRRRITRTPEPMPQRPKVPAPQPNGGLLQSREAARQPIRSTTQPRKRR